MRNPITLRKKNLLMLPHRLPNIMEKSQALFPTNNPKRSMKKNPSPTTLSPNMNLLKKKRRKMSTLMRSHPKKRTKRSLKVKKKTWTSLKEMSKVRSPLKKKRVMRKRGMSLKKRQTTMNTMRMRIMNEI